MDDHDLDRDLEQAGRSIAPDLDAARDALDARAAAGLAGRRPAFLRSALAGAAVAGLLAATLVTAIAVRGGHGSAPSTPAVAGAAGSESLSAITPAPAPASGASGTTTTTSTAPAAGAAAGSATATAAVPITIQPVQTVAPTTFTATSSSATRTPGLAGGNVVITAGTAGQVAVTRGQTVEVDLSPMGFPWTEPQSTDQGVLVRISGSTSPDGSAHALFRAVADGAASLIATQTISCAPKCLPPQRAWDVSVTVSG